MLFRSNRRLATGKKAFVDKSNQLTTDLERLRKAQRENQKEINALVDSLAKMTGTPGEQSIVDGINKRSERNQSIQENIQELEQILQEQNLQAQSFEVLRDMLKSFASTMDDMTVEQKRLAIRVIVKDVVWDGKKVHIYLFGDDDPSGDDIDFPPPDDGQDNPDGPLCEDSKRGPHVLSQSEKAARRGFAIRYPGYRQGWQQPLSDGHRRRRGYHAGGLGHPGQPYPCPSVGGSVFDRA